MKRGIVYSLIFIVFFSISLISSIPASFVLGYLPPVRGLAIEGPSGTIWQGSAHKISWQGQDLGEVNWDVQWMPLLTGDAQVALRFGRGSEMNLRGKGRVGYSLSQVLTWKTWWRRSPRNTSPAKSRCRYRLM